MDRNNQKTGSALWLGPRLGRWLPEADRLPEVDKRTGSMPTNHGRFVQPAIASKLRWGTPLHEMGILFIFKQTYNDLPRQAQGLLV